MKGNLQAKNAVLPGEKRLGDRIVVVCDAALDDIIPEYIEDKRSECPKLRELAGEGDFEEIRSIAHGMKGSGGCYGFQPISDIGRGMEAAAKDGNLTSVLKQVDALEAYLESIDIQYE